MDKVDVLLAGIALAIHGIAEFHRGRDKPAKPVQLELYVADELHVPIILARRSCMFGPSMSRGRLQHRLLQWARLSARC